MLEARNNLRWYIYPSLNKTWTCQPEKLLKNIHLSLKLTLQKRTWDWYHFSVHQEITWRRIFRNERHVSCWTNIDLTHCTIDHTTIAQEYHATPNWPHIILEHATQDAYCEISRHTARNTILKPFNTYVWFFITSTSNTNTGTLPSPRLQQRKLVGVQVKLCW